MRQLVVPYRNNDLNGLQSSIFCEDCLSALHLASSYILVSIILILCRVVCLSVSKHYVSYFRINN